MDSAVFVDSGSYHTPESKYTGSLAWLYTLLDAEPTLVFPLVVAYFMIGYAVSVMSLATYRHFAGRREQRLDAERKLDEHRK